MVVTTSPQASLVGTDVEIFYITALARAHIRIYVVFANLRKKTICRYDTPYKRNYPTRNESGNMPG